MVVAAGGLLLVVADCTCGCGWWWRAVLVYGGGFGHFFFLGCGFRVIVGGGGVRLIPCDLGCINGVYSSLYFILFYFFRVLW